jgi:hypothetical protein
VIEVGAQPLLVDAFLTPYRRHVFGSNKYIAQPKAFRRQPTARGPRC